jgi:hypothetical protein
LRYIHSGAHLTVVNGEPQPKSEEFVFGQLTAAANLNTRGELIGEWTTTIGSAGTFILFPHDPAQALEAGSGKLPD